MTKVCIRSGVEVMDLCFIRTAMLFSVACFQLVLSKGFNIKESIVNEVPKDKRVLLVVRCLLGLIGFTSIIAGISLI